jgi:hypothetical protein
MFDGLPGAFGSLMNNVYGYQAALVSLKCARLSGNASTVPRMADPKELPLQ